MRAFPSAARLHLIKGHDWITFQTWFMKKHWSAVFIFIMKQQMIMWKCKCSLFCSLVASLLRLISVFSEIFPPNSEIQSSVQASGCAPQHRSNISTTTGPHVFRMPNSSETFTWFILTRKTWQQLSQQPVHTKYIHTLMIAVTDGRTVSSAAEDPTSFHWHLECVKRKPNESNAAS